MPCSDSSNLATVYILMYFSLTEDSTTVLGFRCSSRDGPEKFSMPYNNKQWTFDYLGVKQSAVTLRGQTARANSCTCVDLALQGSGLCRTTPRGDGAAAAPPGDSASVSVCRASRPPWTWQDTSPVCHPRSPSLTILTHRLAQRDKTDPIKTLTAYYVSSLPSLGADNMTHLVESKTWKSSPSFLVNL